MTTAAEATISGDPQASHNIGPDFPTICCSPEDMGDLVEYAWGDESTTWGKQRIADGHPKPYNVTWFELGDVRACTAKFDPSLDCFWCCRERAEKLALRGPGA